MLQVQLLENPNHADHMKSPKKGDEGKILFYTLPQCCVVILMSCCLFFTESNDPSISEVRKQVHRNICKNVINHSDVEVVDHIPNNPQDDDKEESSEDEDQDKLIDAGNLQESSDKYVDLDDDSDDSADQDNFMLKTTTDTICLKDNIVNSGRHSNKNRTKKFFSMTILGFLLKSSLLTCLFLPKTSFLVLN